METFEQPEECSQFSLACDSLGLLYDKLPYRYKMKHLILEYYTLAAKHGDKMGYYNLGGFLRQVMHDYDGALYWMTRYVKECPNDCDGYEELYLIHRSLGNYEKWREYLKLSFEHGNYNAFMTLLTDEKDRDKREEIADMAYAHKNKLKPLNIGKLGLEYHNGKFVSRNIERALELYHIAADKGDVPAMYNLGSSYKLGADRFPINYELGFKYLTMAADLNDTDAQRDLAEYYVTGMGNIVPRDPEKVKELYKKSAEHNWRPNPYACFKMMDYTDVIEEKEEWLMKSLKNYNYSTVEQTPKIMRIPTELLYRWKKLVEKIPELESRINELELRPPELGGPLYEEAKKRFTENTRDFL
jgi:TPR repeat protein